MEHDSRDRSAVVQVSNHAGKAAFLTLAILGVLFSLAMLAGGPPAEALIPVLLVGIPALYGVGRIPRIGLSTTEHEVVVRNVGRTHRVPRDHVETIRVGDGSNETGLTSVLIVERRSGKPIKAKGSASSPRRP